MRTCFISHSSGVYGAEKALFDLLIVLKEKGINSIVVLPSFGPLCVELKKNGIDFFINKYWWWISKDHVLWKRIARTILNFPSAFLIALRLKRFKINLICSNTLTISVGMFVAKILKIPHIYFIHEFGKEHHGLQFDIGENLSLALMDKLSLGIICNSMSVKEKFSKYFSREKLFVVYQYVSLGDFEYNPETQHEVNFQSEKNSLNCVIVGALQKGKRQEDAVLAVSELIKKGLDVRLEIVGDGEPEYKLYLFNLVKENKLEDYVHFHGYVNPPFSIILKSDVLLMCSRHEAFGRVTVEALLLGRPVIGARSGGTLELIKEGFNGLLYTPGNYHELSEKIEYIYFHREEASKMGKNGYSWASKLFTKEMYSESFLKVLDILRLTR